MNNIIKYGIGKEYLPNWGVKEALREVYQNFKDWGEYTEEQIDNNLILCNDYFPNNLEFLKIGQSYKRDDNTKIGDHGEGLKMALMIFHRNNIKVKIETNKYKLSPTFYEDEYLGLCFGLKLEYNDPKSSEYQSRKFFKVKIKLPEENLKEYREQQFTKDDIIFSCYRGEILNKPAGDVYVGGLYVANLDILKYSYNFPVETIPLDRDRSVPKTFDIQWQASRILEQWPNTKIDDILIKDAEYVDYIPKEISNKLIPIVTKNKISFKTLKGEQIPERLISNILKNPKIQKEVEKLRYVISKKRKPESLLKEFSNMHLNNMNLRAKIDFNILLKKSKLWK